MHELSIASGIVEAAIATAERLNVQHVTSVSVRVGRLSGVEPAALLFSYDVVARGTLLDGSRLEIEEVPVVVWCDRCEREVELPAVNFMHCPICDEITGTIRQGKELEVTTMEIEE